MQFFDAESFKVVPGRKVWWVAGARAWHEERGQPHRTVVDGVRLAAAPTKGQAMSHLSRGLQTNVGTRMIQALARVIEQTSGTQWRSHPTVAARLVTPTEDRWSDGVQSVAVALRPGPDGRVGAVARVAVKVDDGSGHCLLVAARADGAPCARCALVAVVEGLELPVGEDASSVISTRDYARLGLGRVLDSLTCLTG
jgi:hypothetical protein